MAIQMTRAEYESKYGSPPTPQGVQNTPVSATPKIKMTRAEYQNKYGQLPTNTVSKSPVNIEQQKQERIAQGLPVSVREDRVDPTLGGQIVRAPLKLASTIASTVVPAGRAIAGEEDVYRPIKSDYLGDVYSPGGKAIRQIDQGTFIDTNKSVGQNIGRAIGQAAKGTLGVAGTGAEAASYAVGGGALPNLGKQALLKFAGTEALAGGLGAFGASTQNAVDNATSVKEGLGNIAKDTAIGAGIGVLGGGLIGGASKLPKAPSVIKNAVVPDITPERAVGYILQGSPQDKQLGMKALSNVDTSKVKTFKELSDKLIEKQKSLIDVVDNELLKDTKSYLPNELATKFKTKGGVVISKDYVNDSLNNLKEFYSTTGDTVKQVEIDEMLNKYKNSGLTRYEVNNIARTYNSEFGNKAFSPKSGEPLTSVNAQLFENNRKGLKEVARNGIGGKEAKEADDILSATYNTQRLIKNNVNAVNKLQQRIKDRGLLEKAGYYLTKYADILTGGTVRGAVGGLLPRGVGNKVMNALDVEEMLAKNLAIIQKASNSKTDAGVIGAIQKIRQSIPE